MSVYLTIFALSTILGFVFYESSNKGRIPFILFMVLIGSFVGLGDMLGGYDRYIYGEVFDCVARLNKGDITVSPEIMNYFSHEPLYGAFNSVIGKFTGNRYIFILIFTIIMYAIYAVAFLKNSEHPFFSFIIFLGFAFFFTFTYLRQVMAMGVAWMAIPYATNRKLTKFIVVVLIATLIHNSALIFAVIYFIPRRQFSRISIVACMLILMLLGFTGLLSSLFGAFGDVVEAAADKADATARNAEYGFRIEYVLEALALLTIFLIYYKKIKLTQQNISIMNVYLMFCGILLLFCRSTDGGRVAWYGVLGIACLLPKFVDVGGGSKVKVFSVILSFALYLRILIGWGVMIAPYKTFLTPGVRYGDWVADTYEYDHEYDINKLKNLWW